MHVLTLLVIVGTLALGGSAARAACPENDPDCGLGGGGVVTFTKHLYVVDSTQATVTAAGINCGVAGDDCTEAYSYTEDEQPPSVTMIAGGVPAGYTARLFSCTATSG